MVEGLDGYKVMHNTQVVLKGR